MTWSQPCCEACWISRNAVIVDQNGDTSGIRIASVRMPTVIRDPDIEQCAFCGSPTIVGIFVRADPKSVPFPAGDRGD